MYLSSLNVFEFHRKENLGFCGVAVFVKANINQIDGMQPFLLGNILFGIQDLTTYVFSKRIIVCIASESLKTWNVLK